MEFHRFYPLDMLKCVHIPFRPTLSIRCSSSLCVRCIGAVTGISLSCCLSWERADSCALLSSESRVWEFTRWQRQMTAERKQPAGRTPPYLTLPRLDHPFRKPSTITLSFLLTLSFTLLLSQFQTAVLALLFCMNLSPYKILKDRMGKRGGTSYANKRSKCRLQVNAKALYYITFSYTTFILLPFAAWLHIMTVGRNPYKIK